MTMGRFTFGNLPFRAAYAPTPAVHATVATAANEAENNAPNEAIEVRSTNQLPRFRIIAVRNCRSPLKPWRGDAPFVSLLPHS